MLQRIERGIPLVYGRLSGGAKQAYCLVPDVFGWDARARAQNTRRKRDGSFWRSAGSDDGSHTTWMLSASASGMSAVGFLSMM